MAHCLLGNIGLLSTLVGWHVAYAEYMSAPDEDVNGPIEMPNLGRGFTLGSLYDARIDKRVGGYLWPLSLLKDSRYVKEVSAKNARYKFAYDDTFKDKAAMMEISNSLAVKVKTSVTVLGSGGGSDFNLHGSSKFLGDSKSSAREARASVAYRLRSFQQNLDVFNPDLKAQMHTSAVADGRATHVVSSVTWGSDCIATFSKKTSSLQEKADMQTFMSVAVKTMTDINVPIILDVEHEVGVDSVESNKFSGQSFDSSLGISVRVQGDVMPFGNETLPTDVQEAISFLKRLHQHGIGDGGVPMDLVLVPIAWLDDKAAKVTRKIESSKIDEALSIFNALDESVETMNDLLEIPTDGFMAWAREVQAELDQLQKFRATYTQDVSDALDSFTLSGDTSKLSDLFEDYYTSPYRTSAIQKSVETRRDEIINLKALVSSMRAEAGVPAAEHFSDYMAPSLNQKYAKVYTLLLTGMNPSLHRASISLVRDFTALARSLLQSMDPATYCLTASVDSEVVCLEHYMFSSIHFDTFCEQFCPEALCRPKPRQCTDPAASASIDFVQNREAWCQNPCTMVLEFPNNMAPIRADTRLPVLPGIPTITEVEGAQHPVEPNPLLQKVMLTVSTSGRGLVNNFRVRVIWLTRSSDGGASRWIRNQREFDTTNNKRSIIVRGLTAGRKYTFQVAGMNVVGVGPFSEEYRIEGGKMLMVAYNMATLSPVEDFAMPRLNAGPSFMAVRYHVKLSMPGEEPIGSVRFRDPDLGPDLKCEEYEDATVDTVTCVLSEQTARHDSHYQVVVMNANDDEEIAWGNFTHEALSGPTCYASELQRRLLCNSTGRCVQACDECQEMTVDDDGMIKLHNTSEVTSSRLCTADMCPDNGAEASIFCPAVEALISCFAASFGKSDESCRRQCHALSTYNSDEDMCALPCNLEITGMGLSQRCGSVMPGTSCDIECNDGFTYANGGGAFTFMCKANNNKGDYDAGDPALQLPTCAALCSLFTCPAGWNTKPDNSEIIGTAKEDCCNEVQCGDGLWGPAETTPCQACTGAVRRRRATSCSSCSSGHIPEQGQDDCAPFCKTYTCSAPYAPKPNVHTIPGTGRDDCCSEVQCSAGLYHPSGSTACAACSSTVRRRRADACTGCPGGYTGQSGSDDCREVTCGAGYWRSGTSCHACNGATRRRRATSCTGCPTNYQDNGNNDDCAQIRSVSGFSSEFNRDCNGGDMPRGVHRTDIKSCGGHCAGRWDCGGFSYRYSDNTCKLKWLGHCNMVGSSMWNFFRKR